jgi:hypothetical protein
LECAVGEGVLILLAALALFVFVLIAVRRGDGSALMQKRTGRVRAITAVLAAAIAAGAAFWLDHLTNRSDSYTPAYLLTAAIGSGAALYLGGTLLGRGRVALRLRWIGWIVMAVPLLVPSTFSLALPLIAALAVTLRPMPPRPASTTMSDVLVPR